MRNRHYPTANPVPSTLLKDQNYVDFDSSKAEKMGTKYILDAKIGYPVQIRTPDLHTIRNISSCLKGQWRKTFEKMHGNLLQILEIETRWKHSKL
ncbi:hypothetical protein CR513_01048, partial [Mucuna pruriens]